MGYIQSAQPVIAGPKIETPGPRSQQICGRKVSVFHLLGILLNESVSILSKTAACGEQQSFVAWTLGKKTLYQFKTEWQGLPNQVRIVIGRESSAAAGKGVSELTNCISPHRAAAIGHQQDHGNGSEGSVTGRPFHSALLDVPKSLAYRRKQRCSIRWTVFRILQNESISMRRSDRRIF